MAANDQNETGSDGTTERDFVLEQMVSGLVPMMHLRGAAEVEEVVARWGERQRCWHGLGHLRELLTTLRERPEGPRRDALVLAAVYHDAIYDPRAGDNEE